MAFSGSKNGVKVFALFFVLFLIVSGNGNLGLPLINFVLNILCDNGQKGTFRPRKRGKGAYFRLQNAPAAFTNAYII